MPAPNIDINSLPIEMLLHIFSYLSPGDISNATSVTTEISIQSKDNLFWKQKFETHFPHALNALLTQNAINWYDEFRKNYEKDYQGLSITIKKCFSLVKEGNNEALKKIPIHSGEINIKDKNGFSLLDWIKKKGNQDLLDYYYQGITNAFTDNTGFTVDTVKQIGYPPMTIMDWAIAFHQSTDIINLLILQGSNIHTLNALISAAQEGLAEIVELLLKQGANINAYSPCGATALLFAIENGHKNVVNVLLKPQYSADVNIPLHTSSGYHEKFNVAASYTPLHAAVVSGRKDLVQVLLDNNASIEAIANNGRNALRLAAEHGHAEIAELLLQKNADINARSNCGATALLLAIELGHKNVVDVLLKPEYSADINIPLDTDGSYHQSFNVWTNYAPLHAAIVAGRKDLVQILLDNNASIEAIANNGRNALRLAAEHGHAEIAELLLQKSANINARSNCGATALLLAIELGHKNVVEVLLKPEYSADINIPLGTDGNYHQTFKVTAGDTPLHVASRLGQVEIVQQLLKNGADIELMNSKGQTAADVAVVDTQYSNELKLLNYLSKVNRRAPNHYKTSFTLFCYTKNFGYSAEQKQRSAKALKDLVFFKGSDQKELSRLRKKLEKKAIAEALDQGELGTIYRSFRIK